MADVISFILLWVALAAIGAGFAFSAREAYWDGQCSKIQFERLKNALEKEREQQ